MTFWLTDSPATTARFLPGGLEWMPAREDESAVVAQCLSTLMHPGVPLWTARSGESSRHEVDRTVILADVAERSQFDAVQDALKQGIDVPDHLVCLALTGTRFRGQRMRPWMALRGNLHFTAHYKVGMDAMAAQPALTMVPSVVAAETIMAVSGGRVVPSIKWVNDIWIGDAKVAGVLTATTVVQGRTERVMFGIGVNIARSPEIEPTPFVPRAGCLADHAPDLKDALPAFFSALMPLLDRAVEDLRAGNQHDIYQRYLARAGFIGKEVMMWPEGTEDWRGVSPIMCGRVKHLNQDLSLDMEGSSRPVVSGRMAYRESCHRFGIAR